MMVAGIFNVMWSVAMGIVIFLYASAIMISTFGLGIVCYACLLWPLLPFAMGVTELVVGVQAMNGKPMGATRMTSIIGLVVAVLNMSVIPLILEVVTLVSLNDNEVAGWLEQNG